MRKRHFETDLGIVHAAMGTSAILVIIITTIMYFLEDLSFQKHASGETIKYLYCMIPKLLINAALVMEGKANWMAYRAAAQEDAVAAMVANHHRDN